MVKHSKSMKQTSFKVVFNFKNRKNKSGKFPILIRVIIKRVSYYINSGISIEERFWNQKKNQLATGCPHASEINATLDILMQKLTSRELSLIRENEEITFEKLKKVVDPEKSTKSPLFFEFALKELEIRNDIEESTKRTQRNTISVFEEVNPGIKLEEITYEMIELFEYYLIKNKKAPNTRNKFHRHIRTFINRAIKKGKFKPQNNPYYTFTMPKADTHTESLTISEIKKLADYPFEAGQEKYEQVRDMFIFGCYCGLRISDILTLTSENYIVDNNDTMLSKVMVKTQKKNKRVDLPISDLYNGIPKIIFEKYLNRKEPGDVVFAGIRDDDANQMIKDIARWCGLDKNLTFHVARHTFGTNTAELVDAKTLMELMGHHKLETTMRFYVHKSPERIRKQMKKINWN